ncbi:MAG TPA: PaaI family thioesterase [Candidatus Binatia bacterium]|nr:PaaI family thioesterase [Candidatus Binatia bacterium]
MPVPEDVELTFPQDGGCFGCSPSNPDGLQMRFRRRGERVHARHTLGNQFHGAPHTAHGGIVATMLDEVSCAAVVFVADRFVVTGELTVRYERPCPTEMPLELVAGITDRSHPKYWVVEAEIHAGGERVARSTGRFFLRDHMPTAP